LCISVVLTTWSLALAGRVDPRSLVAQLVAILAGTALAAFGRFVLFRAFVFRTHQRARKC
jgi:hypothetical protein